MAFKMSFRGLEYTSLYYIVFCRCTDKCHKVQFTATEWVFGVFTCMVIIKKIIFRMNDSTINEKYYARSDNRTISTNE